MALKTENYLHRNCHAEMTQELIIAITAAILWAVKMKGKGWSHLVWGCLKGLVLRGRQRPSRTGMLREQGSGVECGMASGLTTESHGPAAADTSMSWGKLVLDFERAE